MAEYEGLASHRPPNYNHSQRNYWWEKLEGLPERPSAPRDIRKQSHQTGERQTQGSSHTRWGAWAVAQPRLPAPSKSHATGGSCQPQSVSSRGEPSEPHTGLCSLGCPALGRQAPRTSGSDGQWSLHTGEPEDCRKQMLLSQRSSVKPCKLWVPVQGLNWKDPWVRPACWSWSAYQRGRRWLVSPWDIDADGSRSWELVQPQAHWCNRCHFGVPLLACHHEGFPTRGPGPSPSPPAGQPQPRAPRLLQPAPWAPAPPTNAQVASARERHCSKLGHYRRPPRQTGLQRARGAAESSEPWGWEECAFGPQRMFPEEDHFRKRRKCNRTTW